MTLTCKPTLALLLGTFLAAHPAFAIGDQHGLFRSQSTQGEQWMGTAEIETEEYRITVHPNYLDVELDWTFRVGGTAPEKFQDALEIVGNLNLAKNSVVVGMLTWWKGDILQGKLKTTEMARADYEEVVQRDAEAPPPPRDPVLLEYGWGIDNYDISIFPATFGETRKVRLHYLIPANAIDGTVKIPYPHAFTDNATVTVQAGEDVASYKIEAGTDIVPFANKTPQPLSATQFSFGAYGFGADAGPRIDYIVPVLAAEPEGSRFYVGAVDRPGLRAEAGHIVVLDAEKVIAKSDLKEDFVILWRWSHPRLLEAYAGQIVSQSKLLQSFLAKLEGARKRAALIIDKEGGERITFTLAKAGDAEHNRMLAFLDSLAGLAVVDPPQVAERPDYKLTADAQAAQSEFEAAMAAAIALFDNDENIRHLLLLTAGPQIVYGNSLTPTATWDSTIQVESLAEYARNLKLDRVVAPEDQILYWPGINPAPLLTQQTLNLGIEAVVGNGSQSCTLAVAAAADPAAGFYASRSEIEKHVFSQQSLSPRVRWTLTRQGRVVSTFEEEAALIPVADPLALSQILGASRALTPMAPTLPRSLAATVGFIDSTYSLVALEEDKLSAEAAAQYTAAGLPDLTAADIHAKAEDLESLTAAQWVEENPPQKIWKSSGRYPICAFCRGDLEIFMMDEKIAVPGGPNLAGNPGAFMPMPVAGELPSQPAARYDDYSRALAAGILPTAKPFSKAFARVTGSLLVVDLAALLTQGSEAVQIRVYDLKGALVYSGSLAATTAHGLATVPLHQISGRGGLSLVQIRTEAGTFQQKLLLPGR